MPSDEALSFFACRIKRDPYSRSWGFALSLFDESYLIFADVYREHLQTVWSCCTSASPDAQILFNPELPTHMFQDYFEQLPRMAKVPPTLLPGDMVIAINGNSMASFSGLEQISSYLRQCYQLVIVVIRHQTALLSLQSAWKKCNNLNNSQRIFFGAQRSYFFLKNFLPGANVSVLKGNSMNLKKKIHNSKLVDVETKEDSDEDLLSEGGDSLLYKDIDRLIKETEYNNEGNIDNDPFVRIFKHKDSGLFNDRHIEYDKRHSFESDNETFQTFQTFETYPTFASPLDIGERWKSMFKKMHKLFLEPCSDTIGGNLCRPITRNRTRTRTSYPGHADDDISLGGSLGNSIENSLDNLLDNSIYSGLCRANHQTGDRYAHEENSLETQDSSLFQNLSVSTRDEQ